MYLQAHRSLRGLGQDEVIPGGTVYQPVVWPLTGMALPSIGALLAFMFKNRVAAAATGFGIGWLAKAIWPKGDENGGVLDLGFDAIQLAATIAGIWVANEMGLFDVARRGLGNGNGRPRRRRRSRRK